MTQPGIAVQSSVKTKPANASRAWGCLLLIVAALNLICCGGEQPNKPAETGKAAAQGTHHTIGVHIAKNATSTCAVLPAEKIIMQRAGTKIVWRANDGQPYTITFKPTPHNNNIPSPITVPGGQAGTWQKSPPWDTSQFPDSCDGQYPNTEIQHCEFPYTISIGGKDCGDPAVHIVPDGTPID